MPMLAVLHIFLVYETTVRARRQEYGNCGDMQSGRSMDAKITVNVSINSNR